MKYVPLSIVRGKFLELDKYVEVLKHILRKWSTRPLRVDSELRVVEESTELYNALWGFPEAIVCN